MDKSLYESVAVSLQPVLGVARGQKIMRKCVLWEVSSCRLGRQESILPVRLSVAELRSLASVADAND